MMKSFIKATWPLYALLALGLTCVVMILTESDSEQLFFSMWPISFVLMILADAARYAQDQLQQKLKPVKIKA